MIEDELKARVTKLEAERRWIWILGGLLVAAMAVAFFLQMRTPRILSAREFALRDASGNIVAKLDGNGASTCLDLFGGQKDSTASLCTSGARGSSLTLDNYTDQSRAYIGTTVSWSEPAGTIGPTIMIGRANGRDLLSATVGANNNLILGHGDHHNSITLSAGNTKPVIEISDAQGKPLRLALHRAGDELHDSQGAK